MWVYSEKVKDREHLHDPGAGARMRLKSLLNLAYGVWGYRMDSYIAGEDIVVGFCQDGNEHWSSTLAA